MEKALDTLYQTEVSLERMKVYIETLEDEINEEGTEKEQAFIHSIQKEYEEINSSIQEIERELMKEKKANE